MKKPKDKLPYLFAIFLPGFSALSNNLLSKEGLLLNWVVMSCVLLGLWRLCEYLLRQSDKRLLRLASVVLGSVTFITAFVYLDYYVLHSVMSFSGFQPWGLGVRLFSSSIVATILLEGANWSREREKARIENLTLQAENIETKYKLLREQVNPEFLFQCLATLQTMVRTNDPQTEAYILKLADVYRQTLKKEKNVTTLREELALLEMYMFLMRYGREAAITFEVEVSEQSLNYQLPIFALQWLGDNCVKHNTFSESQPLNIRIFQKDIKSITISNNYQRNEIPKPFGLDMEQLEVRFELEGIENGILIEKEETTYSTTLKLF